MKENSFLFKLNEFLHQKRFFELRDELKGLTDENSPELLFYRGAVANKFNRMNESIELLQTYLVTAEPSGENLRSCYELLGDNYAKKYEYQFAGEKFGWLIENCADEYFGEDKQHLEYLYNVWTAASDVPPQLISISGDTQIQGTRTTSDHLEIPVQLNGENIDFIFDTGANLSCISASNAEKLDLQIIDRDISIGTATDIRLDVKIAVASSLKFGNVDLKNVIFFLIKDEDLYLKKHNYQLNGIIGYPVMQACRRVSISNDNNFFIPEQNTEVTNIEQNLCFDDMMPLLELTYKQQSMTYVFDTGARKSQFWSKFLKSQESEIKETAKLKVTEFGGAGGRRSVPAYINDELSFSVFGKEIIFKEAQILTEPFNNLNRNFYGNIGQDFMMQFENMTIDFDIPCITFE